MVFTYVPSEDRCYHTTFELSADCPDPLSFAHRFCAAEKEAGDYPGALWSVTGNDAAVEIRQPALMKRLGLES